MKKTLLVLALCFGVSKAWAVSQPQSLGVVKISTATFSGGFAPMSRTIAQLNQLAPTVSGQYVDCSDCAQSKMCRSSGTATGAWTITNSTDTFPTAVTIHCR